jgi:PAS domain-containing protein
MRLFKGRIEPVSTMEALFTMDEDGHIITCNQHFVQPLFGYSSEELINKNISILMPEIHQTTKSNSSSSSSDESSDSVQPYKKQKISSSSPSSSSIEDNSNLNINENIMTTSWKSTGVHRKQLRHKDGSIFPVNLEINPFKAQGRWLFSARIKRVSQKIDSESSPKSIGNYTLIQTIGQGSYGKVKLAHHKITKTKVI